MTLHAQTEFTVPEETRRVARAAYPHGNTLIKMRDALGTIYQNQSFASLFPHNGRAVEAPWRLALITVLQFMEELPDRQAADAVRGRIDWKYLLGLELADPGFDASVLCEFRKRLVQGGAEQMLLDALLALCKERGWLKARERQRTDSTHILAKVRAMNRHMCVGEAMRFALNSLAVVAPDWLLAHGDAEWVERYGHRIEESRLPKSEGDRLTLAELMGEDGWKVLSAVFDPLAPAFLREIPAIQVLRQIWVQNYWMEDEHLRWRAAEHIPPATLFINSPYDPEAHLGKKRSTLWTGYKVHLTETCEQTLPHLITHVATTPAPKTDEAMTQQIQEELHQAELAPGEHFVDAGYVSARVLVKSQERFGVEVVGPVSVDTQWQARTPSGIDASQFVLDWENRQAICPQEKTSTSWSWLSRKSHPDLIKIQFSTTDCRSCPRLSNCVQSTSKYPRRTLVIRPQAQHAALQAARQRQRTETFQQKYALRAGIEATISQGVRAFDLRRSRYLGLPKTHLQHLGIAAAINLVRLVDWLDGNPIAPTRVSAFERLYKAA
ncbi:MAG: IS1182-like element ISGvi6 family transposase [Ktedonobacteraceae bacterium]